MNRPRPATREQQSVARALNKKISKADTIEAMLAVRDSVRAAWIAGDITRRQLNAIREKFQYRRVYTFNVTDDTIPRL